MNGQPNAPKPASLVGISVAVFLPIFMVIVLTTTLVTFILPESYASEARLKLSPTTISSELKPAGNPYDASLTATEVETIRSEIVLGKVVEQQELNMEWGRKYASGEKLKTSESLAILKGRLDVRSLPNTTFVSIRAFSEDREEAARLANAVAEAYINASPTLSPFITVQLIDRSQPGLRPIRPNKPLNIASGIVVGIVVGGVCAACVAALTAKYRVTRRRVSPPPGGGLKPIH